MDAGMPPDELLDGVMLWQEHKPQSAEDWLAVARGCLADPEFKREQASPIFQVLLAASAALAAAEAEKDRYRIEADCALRDCDAMDLERGLAEERAEKAEAENARMREELLIWIQDENGECVLCGLNPEEHFDECRLAPLFPPRPDETEACDRCHGDGTITVGGASVNPHTGALGPDPQVADDVTCPDCGGTGAAA